MTAWLAQHFAALRDALARLTRAPLASLVNIAVIGIALSLPLGLYVLLANLDALSGQIGKAPQVSVFLALDASAGDANAIEAKLKQQANVQSFEFVGREAALESLKRRTRLSDVLAGLPNNPLPDAFVIHPRDPAPAALEALRAEIAHWPKVAQTQFDSLWAQRLDAALKFGRRAALLLAALLAAALAAVTFNTIRLQILTRREEIEVAQLIGATRAWIRRPFLYFGALQGAAGAVLAWALVAGALYLLNQALADLLRLYALEFHLQHLDPTAGIKLLLFAAALAWLGAWLSVGLHLRHPK